MKQRTLIKSVSFATNRVVDELIFDTIKWQTCHKCKESRSLCVQVRICKSAHYIFLHVYFYVDLEQKREP